eukprot:318687-Pyramimonas_sp.AAC.1
MAQVPHARLRSHPELPGILCRCITTPPGRRHAARLELLQHDTNIPDLMFETLDSLPQYSHPPQVRADPLR